MALPLENLRVLLVEDDPIIALDLQRTIEAAGAVVVGPEYDLAGGLAALNASAVNVAVLDHRIGDKTSLPIAERLFQRGVPFLFHTSHRGELGKQYPTVPIINKPSRPGELVGAIQTLLKVM